MSDKYDYDVIIIGAGIGGLVCGCYLAKAGMKVLIVEKNAKPGGYCTSFTRGGFTFDACVHSLGSGSKEKIIGKVLQELGIYDRINLKRFSPTDIIISQDFKISFETDLKKTIFEIQKQFPFEKEIIGKFLNYLANVEGLSYLPIRNITFDQLMDKYFYNKQLKNIFSLLLFGNLGLPSTRVSAVTAIKFYQQFIIDGGYYPGDAMQVFPDLLALRFNELGGKLMFNSLVRKIHVDSGSVKGVSVDNGCFFSSKYVVSACDVVETFFQLIDEEIFKEGFLKKIYNFTTTLPLFILYFGFKSEMINKSFYLHSGTNFWILPDDALENMYIRARNERIEHFSWFMVRIMPNNKSGMVFVNAPYADKNFWKQYKIDVMKTLISRLETIFPGISKCIVFKDAATPQTLFRWTLNYRASAYGWEMCPEQSFALEFSRETLIKNLYLAGHWTTLAQGVPGVAYLGRDTAKIISAKEGVSL